MRRVCSFCHRSCSPSPLTLGAQTSPGVDTATINAHSRRGDHAVAGDGHALVAVRGLRAARDGTPGYQAGADWAMKKFNEWGLKNVHIERFPFGQGWTIERFSAHLLTPQAAPLIGHAALVLAVDQRARSRRMSCT